MGVRHPAKRPVKLPDHLDHGNSYVYRHFKCRCGRCQDWRRAYDAARSSMSRRGTAEPAPGRRRPRKRNPWYVCVYNGRRYRAHQYGNGICIRCDARQAIEELWEQKWIEGTK